jgi:hypothetical protein
MQIFAIFVIIVYLIIDIRLSYISWFNPNRILDSSLKYHMDMNINVMRIISLLLLLFGFFALYYVIFKF